MKIGISIKIVVFVFSRMALILAVSQHDLIRDIILDHSAQQNAEIPLSLTWEDLILRRCGNGGYG